MTEVNGNTSAHHVPLGVSIPGELTHACSMMMCGRKERFDGRSSIDRLTQGEHTADRRPDHRDHRRGTATLEQHDLPGSVRSRVAGVIHAISATNLFRRRSMELKTERLILRELKYSDWPDVLAYQSDPLYLRYYDWTGRTPEAVQEFVQMLLTNQQQQPRIKFQLASCSQIHSAVDRQLRYSDGGSRCLRRRYRV